MLVDKKTLIIILSIVIIINIALVLIHLGSRNVSAGISENPKDWIDSTGSTKSVNVSRATLGQGYYVGDLQQYNQGAINTAFLYDGLYKGVRFDNEYMDKDENVLIRITPNLDPTNRIMEGMIVMSIEDGKPVANIFLDEDWKGGMPDTNIIWGANYEHFQKFNFEKIANGVYYSRIDDDSSRFDPLFRESKGGIIVGDMTPENIKEKDFNSSTVIRMR